MSDPTKCPTCGSASHWTQGPGGGFTPLLRWHCQACDMTWNEMDVLRYQVANERRELANERRERLNAAARCAQLETELDTEKESKDAEIRRLETLLKERPVVGDPLTTHQSTMGM